MRALDRLAGPVLARRLDSDSPLDVLVRLLLLGVEVERDVVRAVLHAPFEAWEGLGLVETTAGRVRARYRLVPHGDLLLRADWPAFPGRPLRPDHVLGPNPTASLLADITVRPRLGSVLDLGTGCGIQALLAARHADRVVASDLNPRAVGIAAFNAALNGIDVDCVEGDLFEPVRGQRFDLVVSNPPFVISPDTSLLFRDSALGGEGISRRIISDVAGLLNETGFCQLLTNWAHVEGVDWRGRLEEAFAGCGCNAWVLELDRAEPDIYAGRWIQPGTRTAPVFAEALDHWMRYYERERITAISWCAVTMRRASGPRTWIELDEMPAPIRAPAGDHVLRCFDARELLAGLADDALLAIRPRLAPDTRLEHQLSATGAGWAPVETRVRLTGGLPVEQAVDPGVANLLLHSDGRRSVRELLALAAGEAGVPTDAVAPAGVGVIRRLLADAFLLPC
ncbi:MAG TPA: methyltransferase [Acidimicrobiales bacterium]|nr:methyltransferase [Acidimicrobiales bacterium]